MLIAETKSHTRGKDLGYLVNCIDNNNCCTIVGISNIGKSNLLHQIRQPGILSKFSSKMNDGDIGFIHVDFNLQLQMTGQGFYELVLRTILNELQALQVEPDLIKQVENSYQQVIAPTDEFQNALSFNQAIISLCENWSRRLVLLFDEFDEVFHGLDTRVFLNLRALRDKYRRQILYILTVDKPLSEAKLDKETSEFAELFAHHTYHLEPLEPSDVKEIVKAFMEENDVHFSKKDISLIIEQSGGHPGLLKTVCEVTARDTVDGVAPNLRMILTHLADNNNIRTECAKLWNALSPPMQNALLGFIKTETINRYNRQILLKKGIFRKKNGEVSIFGQLFHNFVRRQQLIREEPEKGVLIDIETGHIFVNGKKIEALTKLEYRLLLLLYGHINQLCDKYRVVEAVWGTDYIDEIDDARIEKLVSRLRQKIEPDPAEPIYLLTVRGRGYRLQSNH